MTDTNGYSHDLETLKVSVRRDNSSRKTVQWLLLIIVLIVAGASGIWLLEPVTKNKSELVYNEGFGIAELTETQAWISEATEKALSSYLAAGSEVHVLNRTIGEQHPVVRSNADWLLKGRLVGNPNTQSAITLVIELVSVKTPKQSFSAEIAGTSDALNDLCARASSQIYEWLEKQPLSTSELELAALELPSSKVAQEKYAEGLEALEKYDGRGAIMLLSEAIAEDNDHPILLSAISSAWEVLGYTEEAKLAAKQAFDASQGLSRDKQLELEAQFRTTHEEWERAASVYGALKEYHPDDITFRIRAAEIYLTTGDHDKVWQALQEMRALPATLKSDPRIDLIEARYWHQKGNYAKSAEIADNAVVKARRTEEKSILAAALLEAVYSDTSNKRAYLTEAQSLVSMLNNPRYQSAILAEIAEQNRYDADLESSEENYRLGLEIAENVGDEVQASVLRQGLAITLDLKGKLSAGYELKKKVMAFEASRGNRGRESIMMENIGISLFKLGRYQESEQYFNEALIIFHEIGDDIGIAWSPYHLSRIRSRSGDLRVAQELALVAVENSEQNPEGDLELNAEFEVAETNLHKGELLLALDQFKSLENQFSEKDNFFGVAESMVMQARIHIRLENYDLAASKLDAALTIYDDANAGYYRLSALLIIDDLNYLDPKVEYADQCRDLKVGQFKTEYTIIDLRAQIRAVRCRFALQEIDLPDALEELQQISLDAQALEIFEPQLEATIMQAEFTSRYGNNDVAPELRESAFALSGEMGWSVDGLMRN